MVTNIEGRRKEIRRLMAANSRTINRIWLATGIFDYTLMVQNDRLADEMRSLPRKYIIRIVG